jgi:hypothetical protein
MAHRLDAWMYRGGRPNRVARLLMMARAAGPRLIEIDHLCVLVERDGASR